MASKNMHENRTIQGRYQTFAILKSNGCFYSLSSRDQIQTNNYPFKKKSTIRVKVFLTT